jgi:hypothetical protein
MTDNNSFAKNLLATRGRRAVATLLTWLEDNAYQYLPADVQTETRGKVLSVIGEFQDLAMDMVASDTGIINDFWAEELAEMKSLLRRIDGHLEVPAQR